MATTVGQHSVAAFTSPVNGTSPIDANTVRGNDNTVRSSYNDHDSDTGIHVQSSTLASRPAAGTAGRKWITADTADYHLWYDDGTSWHEVGNSTVEIEILADNNIAAGKVIKITGFNNGQGVPTADVVSSSSDVAFAIADALISQSAKGYVINTGIVKDVDTSAFSVGDILYPNTSGGFTTTKPTSGNYQPCAYVLRSNASNGALFVEFSAPRIVERSDNTASTVVLRDASGNFSAGQVTFTGLKGTGSVVVTNILDEDNMASDSATALATQQSIKAYVDANTGSGTLNVAGTSGTGSVDLATQTLTIAGTTNEIETSASGQTITIGLPTAISGVTSITGLTTVDTTSLEATNLKAKDGTASATIADSTGKFTISTELSVDNININGNTIISTDTNGDISLTPNGTGEVNITKVDIDGGAIDGTVIGANSAAAGTFTTLTANTSLTVAGNDIYSSMIVWSLIL